MKQHLTLLEGSFPKSMGPDQLDKIFVGRSDILGNSIEITTTQNEHVDIQLLMQYVSETAHQNMIFGEPPALNEQIALFELGTVTKHENRLKRHIYM